MRRRTLDGMRIFRMAFAGLYPLYVTKLEIENP